MNGSAPLAALAAASLAAAVRLSLPYLLPHGPAVDLDPRDRPAASGFDPGNVSLRAAGGKLTKIHERVEEGGGGGRRPPFLVHPETIVFDEGGTMYVMNEDAVLVSLTDLRRKETDGGSEMWTAKATEEARLGPGRPLGGKFDAGGCLYFADAILGLARICRKSPGDGGGGWKEVELVASGVRSEDGTWSPIALADDVDVGPRTGHVYFTDATDIHSDRDPLTQRLDLLYSSKLEMIRGKRTGRLLRYKPEIGEVDVLAAGAQFANGVAVDADETFLLFVSTGSAAVMKYHLTGERAGTTEQLPLRFPGYVDGVDCSHDTGRCYAAVPSPVPSIIDFIFSLPPWLDRRVRTLLLAIPRAWAPAPVPYGGAVEFLPGTDDAPARILRVFQDPDGRDVGFVTGVTERDGKLYLGSLHNDFVGVVSLD